MSKIFIAPSLRQWTFKYIITQAALTENEILVLVTIKQYQQVTLQLKN